MSTAIASDPRHQPAGFVQERLDAMLRMTSDPSFDITGMPPNMGNFPLKHVDTFSGRASNFALAYLPSDEAIQHSWQNAKAMRNDVGIAECIEARQRCTALLDWHLEPENDSSHEQKELCAELTKIIERIPRFVEYRNNLMHAIWYGKYAIQNRYRWVSIEGRDRVMPARVRDSAGWLPINGDKLVFRFDDGDPLKADQLGIRVGAGYGIGGDFNGYKVERAEPTGQGLAYFLPDWQRDALCVHKHMIEDADWEDPRNAGTIHGVGIRSRIYWEWFQKQNALAFLMEYLERSAGGMEVWTYPAGDPTALANAKAAARERMGNGRNIIFFPKPLGEAGDMYDVRIIEAGMAGIESLKDILITYFGHRIKRYILGQTLSTEAEATGLGSGVADLHLDSLLQIVKYDATNLEETLTYDLVRNLKNWNFPWARGIHVRFVIDTESPEVEKKLQAWMQAWQMGAKLKASDVMELIGASPPGPDDEVLQQPQQMGGMPGQEPGGNQFAGVDLNDLAERAKQQVTTAIAGTPEPERYSADFDESKVKRDDDGKFAEKEGAKSKKPSKSGDSSSAETSPVKSWAAKKFDNPEHAKAFVEWFGDSKVVDEKGEPLVVYHGTSSEDDFEELQPSGAASKKAPGAIWITDSPDMANLHAERKPNGKGRVIPAYVAMKNPKVIDLSGSDEAPDHSELWDAKDEGHDGVIFTNAKDGNTARATVYAAFDSSQIKSATGNAGTFDPSDNRITYAADSEKKDTGWRTIGGSPVHIGANGKIDAACPGLKGENVEDLIDEEPESRKRREVRQTHAEARGLPGQEPSGNQFAGVDLNELAERAKQQVTAAIAGTPEPERYSAEFDESKVKRDDDGKFAEKEGAKSKKPSKSGDSSSAETSPVKSWAAKKFDNPEHAKAFVEWFGDSKVVDEKGEPLVVYHGTNAEFDKFEDGGNKRRGAVLGYGSYFTTDPDRAAVYAGEEGGSHLKPIYLAIRNPMILDGELTQHQSDSLGRELARHATNKEMLSSPRETSPEMGKDESKALYQEKLNEWKEHGGGVFRTKPKINRNGDKFSIEYTDTSRASVSRNAAEAFRDIFFAMGPDSSSVLASAGFDGVKRGDEYVAFSPNQIKSATGNAGTFDPKDNRITYSADSEKKDTGWRTIGGSPVHIGTNGKIDAGCPGLKGENVEDLIDEDPESRKRREVRQTHAEARGLTGHDVSASQAKKLHNQGLEKQYEAASTAAKKFGVATADVVRALPDAHQMLLEQWSVEEQARKRARQMTGLNAGVLAKIENSYRDYSSVPGFDDAAASMAEEFPHLGFGRSGDIAAEVWEFMRHGSDKQPQLHDEATAELAAEIIANPKKHQDDESEGWTDSGFEDGELAAAGGFDDDSFDDDSFDPDKFAKKGAKSQDGQGEFRWITLNGGDGDGGGTHVKINGKGDVVAGPAGLADKGIKNLKDFGKDEDPKKSPAPKKEPEGVPGMQMGLFNADEYKTGQMQLFNVVRPSGKKTEPERKGPSELEKIEDELKADAEKSKPMAGQKQLEDSSGKSLVKEHRDKQMSASHNLSQLRAKSGGEYGPNGEWYDGGAWIATTDMPKKVKQKIAKAATGKVVVEPGRYEVPPAGKISILDAIGGTYFNHRNGELNQTFMDYQKLGEEERQQVKDAADAYKNGERFVDASKFWGIAKFNDIARMMEAEMPLPGRLAESAKRAFGASFEKYKPNKTTYSRLAPNPNIAALTSIVNAFRSLQGQ